MTRQDTFPKPMKERDEAGIEQWGLEPRPWGDEPKLPPGPHDLPPDVIKRIRRAFE